MPQLNQLSSRSVESRKSIKNEVLTIGMMSRLSRDLVMGAPLLHLLEFKDQQQTLMPPEYDIIEQLDKSQRLFKVKHWRSGELCTVRLVPFKDLLAFNSMKLEASILQSLDSEFTLGFKELVHDDKYARLVTPFIQGQTLTEYLRTNEGQETGDTLLWKWSRQLIMAIHYLHV